MGLQLRISRRMAHSSSTSRNSLAALFEPSAPSFQARYCCLASAPLSSSEQPSALAAIGSSFQIPFLAAFEGSTFPNNPNKDNTLKEGTHQYNNKSGHNGGSQKGLNIINDSGKRVAPGTSSSGQNVQMTVVNVQHDYQL